MQVYWQITILVSMRLKCYNDVPSQARSQTFFCVCVCVWWGGGEGVVVKLVKFWDLL